MMQYYLEIEAVVYLTQCIASLAKTYVFWYAVLKTLWPSWHRVPHPRLSQGNKKNVFVVS